MYKIRDKYTGLFSNGVISRNQFGRQFHVKWSTKGKEWNTEKALKAHLTKYLKEVGKVENWEIIEVVHCPTKELNDWIDSKMLLALMKHND